MRRPPEGNCSGGAEEAAREFSNETLLGTTGKRGKCAKTEKETEEMGRKKQGICEQVEQSDCMRLSLIPD